jgi:hypothetical protein
MIDAIPEIHSELFRGGGFYKKSILSSLVETFGSSGFTFREANEKIGEFSRSTCRDFLRSGLIKCENRSYPYLYRIHQPLLTHKLTRKEIIGRQIPLTGREGIAS